MINKTVVQFINEFEKRFSRILEPPSQKHREENFYTELFKIKGHMVKEKRKFSDWDLICWLRPEVATQDDLKAIDDFVRKGFEAISGTQLFSLPSLEVEAVIQYMGFMPAEYFAPFLDFQLKGQISRDLWAPTFRDHDEHLRWAVLTGWRKIRNGDIQGGTGARKHYQEQIEPYIPEQERVENTFIDESEIAKYYSDRLQDESTKDAVKFLTHL